MITTALMSELLNLEKTRVHELEEARTIQSLMLPVQALHTAGVTISHEFRPMAAVGGDFLDYFELKDETIGFYLMDVCGKGLPAALYSALAIAVLRGVHKTGTSPGDVLATFNQRLMIRGLPGQYSAVQYALFDPRSGQMQIAGAGMPSPIHFSANDCRTLDISGIPPGMFADTRYETVTLDVRPGDSVLFYTDGLTEALGKDNKPFGTERLQRLCTAARFAAPGSMLGKIFHGVEKFVDGHEQCDDMATVLFHLSA